MFLILGIDALLSVLWLLTTLAAGISVVRVIPRAIVWALIGLIAIGALCAAGVGFVGWQLGLAQMEEAIRNVDPEYIERIREVGGAEARVNLWFGLGSLVAFGGATLLPLGLTFARKTNAPPESDGS